MLSKPHYNLIIIGGGPAGMAMAYSAYQAGLQKILLLERQSKLGGILNQCIHVGFGLHYFKEELTGTEYAARYRKMIQDSAIEIKTNAFVHHISHNKTVTYLCEQGDIQASAEYIVLATGCRERTREMLTVPGPRPVGIYSAGLAQEMVNIYGIMPGKEFVIIGSGDIGLIMARRISLEGGKVLAVLELFDQISGLIRNKVQCLDDFNIPLLLNHQITEVLGRDRVIGLKYTNLKTGTVHMIKCDTLLFSVGLIPERDLLVQNNLSITNGIEVIGNCDYVHELVDHATQEAEKRGKEIATILQYQGVNHS